MMYIKFQVYLTPKMLASSPQYTADAPFSSHFLPASFPHCPFVSAVWILCVRTHA